MAWPKNFLKRSGASCQRISTESGTSSCILACWRTIHCRAGVPILMGSSSFSTKREPSREIEYRRSRLSLRSLILNPTPNSEGGLLDEAYTIPRAGSAVSEGRGYYQEEGKDR